MKRPEVEFHLISRQTTVKSMVHEGQDPNEPLQLEEMKESTFPCPTKDGVLCMCWAQKYTK